MDDKRARKISKRLSYVLRHRPDSIGIQIGEGGWTDTRRLVEALNGSGFACCVEDVKQVVVTNDKGRFSFRDSFTQIRANQGHSIEVDLQLEPAEPPRWLYHGTTPDAMSAIMEQGLRPMSRHHVHLSADIETARIVGSRRSRTPVIFQVDSRSLHRANTTFYVSANGVWLVGRVPPSHLTRIWPN